VNKQEFSELIKEDKYQVFLFASPVPIPFNFAVHTWFVINLKGEINRWEFGKFKGSPYPNGIGVLKNFFLPTEGMNKFFWKSSPRFDSELLNFIEGGENSLAKEMCFFIEKNAKLYSLRNKYILTGPNSNTFTQWILNKFPKTDFKLPLNAIGKGNNSIL
jgi:hypothetical protein